MRAGGKSRGDNLQIYGGELVFNPARHMYFFDGKHVPGVTTILGCIDKPALVGWSAKMASEHWLACMKAGLKNFDTIHNEAKTAHRRKVQKAADIGTQVHAYAEAWCKKLPAPELTSAEAHRGVEAFHKWLDAHKVEIVASERRVMSKQFWFAGTCDLIARFDGELCIGDFKTGKRIYSEARLQTAAYQQAIQEQDGSTYPARWIFRFDKESGNFEAERFADFELDFSGFAAAQQLSRILKTIEQEKEVH